LRENERIATREKVGSMQSLEPGPLTLLVLSDLHFGRLAVSREFAPSGVPPPGLVSNAVSMKQSLVKTVAGETIDAILVSGDLTSAGSPLEFTGCMSVLAEIGEQIGVDRNRIVYTYGNHDVDSQISAIPDGLSPAPPGLKELYLRVGASVGHVVLPGLPYEEPGPVPGCGVVVEDRI
ncbi:MAG TPA: metallophosphoesterase, partial [Deferrisomatales bacterium]|nr:metallophosphoesterase [Deferrisomatales bacterium]